ncbi:MAG: NAD(P)H-dependent oxidoreductase [Pseudomonadales bacterium]|nr:NAD(P)H-dependent oxidoreductase [Pseudomonadales bacterium]
MNVLIVYAHSQPSSFNAALLDTAVQTLGEEGHAVQVSDLYAMKFNPVASEADFKERRFEGHMQYDREQKHSLQQGTFRADIAAEIEKVLWCDLLILQFPLWWYGAPAIMKGWFDRVFVNGLMYGQLGRFDKGGMKGKKAMVSMTTGCFPGMVEEGGVMGHLDAMLWHLQYGTLANVGFDVLEPFVAWSTRYSEDDARKEYLDEYAACLRKLDEIPVKYVHPTEEFGQDWKLKPGIEGKTIGHKPFKPEYK